LPPQVVLQSPIMLITLLDDLVDVEVQEVSTPETAAALPSSAPVDDPADAEK